jgi:hypothetical protein
VGLPKGWQGSIGAPWKCTTGYVDFSDPRYLQGPSNAQQETGAPFHPGPPPPDDQYAPAAAYALTSANPTTVNAVITGFDVVLYNQAGTEVGQSAVTLPPPGQIITPGQRWTWVETSSASLNGQVINTTATAGAFPEAATCRVIYWNPD